MSIRIKFSPIFLRRNTHRNLVYSVALLGLGLPAIVLAEAFDGEQRLERREFDHIFTSARSERMPLYSQNITYTVCNDSTDASDFFWEQVGFGIGETNPLLSNYCLERVDFAYTPHNDEPVSEIFPTRLHLRGSSTSMLTHLWCIYGFADRCSPTWHGRFATWVSTLRLLGEGGTGEAFPLSVTTAVNADESLYRLNISGNLEGIDIVLVAATVLEEELRITPNEQVNFLNLPLFEVLSTIESVVLTGISLESRALIALSTESLEGFSFTIEPSTGETSQLSILLVQDGSIIIRFDTPPLSSLPN